MVTYSIRAWDTRGAEIWNVTSQQLNESVVEARFSERRKLLARECKTLQIEPVFESECVVIKIPISLGLSNPVDNAHQCNDV